MNRLELIELAQASATTDVPTAGKPFGLGTNASYEAVHRGDFPVRVLKIGRKLRVSTSDLLAALGISVDDEVA